MIEWPSNKTYITKINTLLIKKDTQKVSYAKKLTATFLFSEKKADPAVFCFTLFIFLLYLSLDDHIFRKWKFGHRIYFSRTCLRVWTMKKEQKTGRMRRLGYCRNPITIKTEIDYFKRKIDAVWRSERVSDCRFCSQHTIKGL